LILPKKIRHFYASHCGGVLGGTNSPRRRVAFPYARGGGNELPRRCKNLTLLRFL
jgi:hypothetical protein